MLYSNHNTMQVFRFCWKISGKSCLFLSDKPWKCVCFLSNTSARRLWMFKGRQLHILTLKKLITIIKALNISLRSKLLIINATKNRKQSILARSEGNWGSTRWKRQIIRQIGDSKRTYQVLGGQWKAAGPHVLHIRLHVLLFLPRGGRGVRTRARAH